MCVPSLVETELNCRRSLETDRLTEGQLQTDNSLFTCIGLLDSYLVWSLLIIVNEINILMYEFDIVSDTLPSGVCFVC